MHPHAHTQIDKISRKQAAAELGIKLAWLKKLIAFLIRNCPYSFDFTPHQKGITWKQFKMLMRLVELYRAGPGIGMTTVEIEKYLQTNPLLTEEEDQ